MSAFESCSEVKSTGCADVSDTEEESGMMPGHGASEAWNKGGGPCLAGRQAIVLSCERTELV